MEIFLFAPYGLGAKFEFFALRSNSNRKTPACVHKPDITALMIEAAEVFGN